MNKKNDNTTDFDIVDIIGENVEKAEENKNLELAARNIASVKLLLPSNLNVKDLVEADSIVVTENAINEITERLVK